MTFATAQEIYDVIKYLIDDPDYTVASVNDDWIAYSLTQVHSTLISFYYDPQDATEDISNLLKYAQISYFLELAANARLIESTF